jgi:hypothetical protein
MHQATYDDANLLLRLYELRREETLRKARSWFAPNFSAASPEEMMQKYPFGSQEATYTRMVVSYWDMAASLVTSGVLNQELFFQSGRELLVVWERIRGIVGGMREMSKDPGYCANIETVAAAFIKHLEARSPETYPAFQGMLQRMSAPAATQS